MSYTYSIIIPHKDIPDLLVRCLDSIPLRSDIQVIVVDDNSHADKRDFSSSAWWGQPNASFVFTDTTQGAGACRNIGLRAAQGRWVLFADADDYYTERFLEVLDRYAHTSNDVVFFDFVLQSPKNQRYMFHYLYRIDKFLAGTITDKELGLSLLSAWNKMVRRDFLESNGIEFEQISHSNDCMFSTKVAVLSDRTLAIPECLYCYELRSNSLSTDYSFASLRLKLDTFIRINRFLVAHNYKQYRLSLLRFIYLGWKIGFKQGVLLMWEVLRSDTPVFVGFSREVWPKITAWFTMRSK